MHSGFGRCAVAWLGVALLAGLVPLVRCGGAAAAEAEDGRSAGQLDTHDPERELRSFEVLEGFEVSLWAAEPMLSNPIHMTWDPQGRLWVCCSTTYPQVKPGEAPNDQIVVLEDTDRDGRADRSTVFAEGLNVPTGLELGGGGVYVANAPDLLFLKDTDGDLRADERQIVLTGFATEDNHHSISAWRWGPGGWLYFQEGTFMHSQVETPRGVVRLENGGVFQYRPREADLRVYADYRASNPWGHMFDRWGTEILIDNPSLYFLAPLSANSRAKLAYAASGRGTKQCGGEFVSGRHLPPSYRGEVWTNQYKSNTVTRYEIVDEGAGVAASELEPVLRSSDENFRPVDLKMGPDGAVYVLDWYNPLIGHMQHSFRDARRDTVHGRVWRITAKDRPLLEWPEMRRRGRGPEEATGAVGREPGEQIEAYLDRICEYLKSPEDWTRHQARRVLYDADRPAASAALERMVARLGERDDRNSEHARLEALWAYQTIGVVRPPLLRAVARSREAKARAAALRVLRYWHPEVDDPLQLLCRGVEDASPKVRIEAVLTLGYVPEPQSAAIACRALDQPMDRFLEHGLKLSLDGLQSEWLPAYRAGRLTFDSPEHQQFALSSLLSSESVQVAVDLLNAGHVDAERLSGPAEAIARTATAGQLEKLVLALVEQTREYGQRLRSTDPAAIAVLLEALERAARTRGIEPPGVERLLPRTLEIPDPRVQAPAIRLAGLWGQTRLRGRIARLLESADAAPEVRRAAAETLGRWAGPSDLVVLGRLAAEGAAPEDRSVGLSGLAMHDLEEASGGIAAAIASGGIEEDPFWGPAIEAVLSRRDGEGALARALADAPLDSAAADSLLDYLGRIGRQSPELVEVLQSMSDAAASLEARLLEEEVASLAADVAALGDAHRGEAIMRRRELQCMACHTVAGAGAPLGPDLAAVGTAYGMDYLIDSLLRPAEVVKEFYETIRVVTVDGRVQTGILVLEDDEKVVFRDPQQDGKEVTIAADEIEATVKGGSLMPSGLVAKLRDRQEFLDLVRFLSELGKPGAFQRRTDTVVRRWRAASVNPREDLGTQVEAILAGGPVWVSRVRGDLPLGDLAGIERPMVVAAEFEVLEAGRFQIQMAAPAGSRVVLDGRVLEPADEPVRLPAGRHGIGFWVGKREAGTEEAGALRLGIQPVEASGGKLRMESE